MKNSSRPCSPLRTREEMCMKKYPFGEKRNREKMIDNMTNCSADSLAQLVIDLQSGSGYSVCCKTEGVYGRDEREN